MKCETNSNTISLAYQFAGIETALPHRTPCTCESNETHTTLPRKCKHCRQYIMNDDNYNDLLNTKSIDQH